jgi:hypothetical protein
MTGGAGGRVCVESAGSGGKYETVSVTVPPEAMRVPGAGLWRSTVFGGWNELVSCRTLAESR